MTSAQLPPPIEPGDRVGVAALSGPIDAEQLDAGLEALVDLGYQPVEADNLRSTDGSLFAGTDRDRLSAFHRLVADDSIKAVFFARGGHGFLRLVDGIDWQRLGEIPRAYVGYSDLTPFLLETTRRLGVVTFHGPMAAVEVADGLQAIELTSLRKNLEGRFPCEYELEFLVDHGAVSGPLSGGCLSLLASTMGTPYAPRLADSILFLEDVGEPLYRLDRMLTHLQLSGSLSRIRGLIVGHVTGNGVTTALTERLIELAHHYSWTLAAGLQVGHSRPNLTVPIGLGARLDPARSLLICG